MKFNVVSMKKFRFFAIKCLVAFLVIGCGCQVVVVIEQFRAWGKVVAPFEALGARVTATGGDDAGRFAGREGVRDIHFGENVGDDELARLIKLMESFPNLDTIVLEGPKVTDAGLAHLKSLKQLRRLILHNTRATDKGKANLRRELPNLERL